MSKMGLPILILCFFFVTVGCKRQSQTTQLDVAEGQVRSAQAAADNPRKEPETAPEEKPLETAPDCPTVCVHVVELVREGMDEVGRKELDRLKPTVSGMCVRNCLDTLDDEGRRCVAEASTEGAIKQCKLEADKRMPSN